MKASPPSERLFRNLQLLVITRKAYFTYEGLPSSLLSTSMLFVKESNRIPVAKLVLPLISDENNRKMMSKAIDAQGEEWEQAEPNKPIWTFFRKLGVFPLKTQQIDDLLQLDYSKLLEGVDVPNKANIGLFWGGLTDFLINSWSVLEEFRLASALIPKVEKEADELTQSQRDPRITRVIGWADMQLEHHILNVILRLRAGWDKLADYLIVPYYGLPNLSKKEWPKRLDRLKKVLTDQLNSEQRAFWDNILENATQIAENGGLRDVRDFELHKIARRSRETLGDKQSAQSLKQLESLAVTEHYRLQDSFLLFLGMILSGPRTI